MSNFKRNLEAGMIYVPQWTRGLVTLRSPLYVAMSAMGVQQISAYDTLWTGLNVELSLKNTLVRRPGFPKYCSAAFSSSQYPLGFFSFKDLSGNVSPLVDTPGFVYKFTTSAITSLLTKANGAVQTSFQKVGGTLYMADGINAHQWRGGSTTPFDLGIATPVVAPLTATGVGSLLPTAGWSYGYSYCNSTTGAVSTMSPISQTTGNLNIQKVVESSSSAKITAVSAAGDMSAPFTGTIVTFTCDNNFSVGQVVTVSGFSGTYAPINATYVIISANSTSFTTSSAAWGERFGPLLNPNTYFAWYTPVALNGLTGATATLQTITVPPSAGSYTYTVKQSGGAFNTSNLFGGTAPATVVAHNLTTATTTGTVEGGNEDADSIVYLSVSGGTWKVGGTITCPTFSGVFSWLSGITATVLAVTPVPTQSTYYVSGAVWVVFKDPTVHGVQASTARTGTATSTVKTAGNTITSFTSVATSGDVTSTGKFFVDANGDFLFYSGDAGRTVSITYGITPSGGAATVSFTISGSSSANPAQLQSDTTGLSTCDFISLYRTLDGDTDAGPWYLLGLLPNNLALTAVTSAGPGATYTLSAACPAGANNGFASAVGTKGALIAGFANAANNGRFSIIASTTTTITLDNEAAVDETHSGTVNASSWSYIDTGSVYGLSLDPTNQDAELDILIEAPIGDTNNPPPNTTNPVTTSVDGTFSLLAYHAGRLWGAVDNFVYFAGGPDVTYGSPEDSWPPANVFTYPGKVTALVGVNAGLLVFTDSDMFMIYGTSTANFYSNMYQSNFGVASQNCTVQDGDNLFIYSTKRQLFSFTDKLSEIGFAIGDLLKSNFDPATTVLALHRNGSDSGLFVSDGTTNMLKYRLDQGSWSTLAQVVGGAGAIGSIEVTANDYRLLTGRTAGSGYILGRDETNTVFQDSGTSYAANVVIGSFVVAAPGSVTVLESVLLETIPVGTAPTVSILLNEISGTFTVLPNPVNDPPLLVASSTVTSKRYYLRAAQTPLPQQVRHCQVKIAFATENFASEILTLGLS